MLSNCSKEAEREAKKMGKKQFYRRSYKFTVN